MITIAAATMLCAGLAAWRFGWPGVQRLAQLRLRGIWLLLLAAALQTRLLAGDNAAYWYTLGSAILIAVFGALNYRTHGVWLAAGGALLNMAVMLAHGGRMPVHPASLALLGGEPLSAGQLVAGTKGVIGAGQSLLLLLGDCLPLPGAVSGVALWSVGDLLLLAGLVLMLMHTMRGGAVRDATT